MTEADPSDDSRFMALAFALGRRGLGRTWPNPAVGAVVAVAIVIGGYFYYLRKSNAAIESIAVLPFENRSGSADTDYLSDGLADSLIYRLSCRPFLR